MAAFPDPSVNVYVTSVVPTGKESPGLCVESGLGVAPESSVAVGTCQVAIPVFAVAATCTNTPCTGHPEMTGGVRSPVPAVIKKSIPRIMLPYKCYNAQLPVPCKNIIQMKRNVFAIWHKSKATVNNV